LIFTVGIIREIPAAISGKILGDFREKYLTKHTGTQARFRQWLKAKYGDIKELGRAWFRYSYTHWEQVELPRTFGLYPEVFDAIAFWNDNAFYWMKWRADIIRRLDLTHPVIAHGNARSFNDIAPCCGDDFRGAEIADIYGYTFYYGIACHPFLAADLIRSASNGKEFWRAEAIGNSAWYGRKPSNSIMIGKDVMADPDNIRLDFMISIAAGARGYMNPRWRPLLDGPLFASYGWYGMNGCRSERSERASELAKWCNNVELSGLWNASPAKGEAAILILEEAQTFSFIVTGLSDYYEHYYSLCAQGIYEALLDSNIQCDFVKIDSIDHYSLLYVPFPLAIPDDKLDKLKKWVKNGGTLVCEGCFGYFTAHAHALTVQPNRGFSEVFGCTEKDVSFGPDRWGNLLFTTRAGKVGGALYRQSYELTSGFASGWYDDGTIACVENSYGNGSVRLVGTMFGYAYKTRPDTLTRNWIASGFEYAGKNQLLKLNKPGVVARYWDGDNEGYIWVVNQNNAPTAVEIEMDTERIKSKSIQILRGQKATIGDNAKIILEVGGRDAAIIRLDKITDLVN
jgi:beta-galactosidase